MQLTETPPAKAAQVPNVHPPGAGEAQAHSDNDTHLAADLRFADPLIADIRQLWRFRQRVVRAQTGLTLQIRAVCRTFVGGDIGEADKLYRSMNNGMQHEHAEACFVATLGFREARVPLERQRVEYERQLAKMGKRLPIAHVADDIKGIGHLALAKIVGECGDLSQYKSVAAVWKRCGLAVINGERQRKVAGDAALLHGYDAQRRSVLWNIAEPLLKSQGKDETAGPYRLIYDAAKAKHLAKEGITLVVAHNRALREMTKALLKDLTLEWRRVAGIPDQPRAIAKPQTKGIAPAAGTQEESE